MILRKRITRIVVNIIVHLFNAPIGEDETGMRIETIGSLEAIMLAGLAFKRK